MKKAIPVLTILLAIGWVATILAVVHYRSLYQDILDQWTQAEAAWRRGTDNGAAAREGAAMDLADRRRHDATPVAVGGPTLALRDRIRDLEAQLADRERQLAALPQAATNRVAGRATERRDRFPSLEGMRTNNPAFFAEMEKRREEAQKVMQNALARQAEFVLNKDTSSMSAEDREQHEALVRLLDETWKIAQQMPVAASRDERRQLMHALGENLRDLDPLLASERQREFYSLGLSVGYSPAEASHFAEYLNDVIDLTSVRTLFPGFRPSSSRGGRSGEAPTP